MKWNLVILIKYNFIEKYKHLFCKFIVNLVSFSGILKKLSSI